MIRRIGRFLDVIRPTLTVASAILRLALRLTFLVVRSLLSGLAVWLRGIPDSCNEVAEKWEQEAMGASVGFLSKPIYFLAWGLTFVEIIIVSIVMAHIVVFIIFAAVLYWPR